MKGKGNNRELEVLARSLGHEYGFFNRDTKKKLSDTLPPYPGHDKKKSKVENEYTQHKNW